MPGEGILGGGGGRIGGEGEFEEVGPAVVVVIMVLVRRDFPEAGPLMIPVGEEVGLGWVQG